MRAVGAIVERTIRARLEPLPKPENGGQLIVVTLGGSKIGNANADVVNESSSGQQSTPVERSGTKRFPANTGAELALKPIAAGTPPALATLGRGHPVATEKPAARGEHA